MANWPPFPAHVFNGSAIPYNMNLPLPGRPIYAPGPDPYHVIGTMSQGPNPPFPQAQPSMPNSWRGDPHALPPQWASDENAPYLEPVNSPLHNMPLALRRPIQPDFRRVPPNRLNGADSDSNSDSDTTPPWRGPIRMDPSRLDQGWHQHGRGPVRMRAHQGQHHHSGSSDTDSEVDNSMALVPWVPPAPHSAKQASLYAQPTGMGHQKYPMGRPPGIRRPLHRPSRGSTVPLKDSLILVASRPSEWRPDYTPRRGSGLKRGLSRVRTAISSRGSCYGLNPLILYEADACPVYHDLRDEGGLMNIEFVNLQRDSNHLDLYQLATSPPVHEMCLWHPRLPWYIHIEASQANGITIADIFEQMHYQLHEAITSNHFYNVLLTSADREEISAAFARRTDGSSMLRHKGVMRIDFLCSDIIFVGLSKSKDGMWKMKTKTPL